MLESFVRKGREFLKNHEAPRVDPVIKAIREDCLEVLKNAGTRNVLGEPYLFGLTNVDGQVEWVGIYAPHTDAKKAPYIACKIFGKVNEEIRFYKGEPKMAIRDCEFDVLGSNTIGKYAVRIHQLREKNPPEPDI